MKRNKFEKQIKEKLQGREIEPSPEAWNRITEQLESSSNRSRSTWYGIAAGFVGILFCSIVYFTVNDAPVEPGTELSNTTTDTIISTSPTAIPEEQSSEEGPLVQMEIWKEESTENEAIKNQDSSMGQILAKSDIQDKKLKKIALPADASEDLIHTKIAEVVAQVEMLEDKKDSVSEVEIDSLLRTAQREILADKIFRKDNSVDAIALLADVEEELDQSFRDQIFDALKDGFLKVRTAVADRNK